MCYGSDMTDGTPDKPPIQDPNVEPEDYKSPTSAEELLERYTPGVRQRADEKVLLEYRFMDCPALVGQKAMGRWLLRGRAEGRIGSLIRAGVALLSVRAQL